MTDNQLITHIRTGDTRKALLVLYKHFPQVAKQIVTRGGNRHAAEDIFQETLLIFTS